MGKLNYLKGPPSVTQIPCITGNPKVDILGDILRDVETGALEHLLPLEDNLPVTECGEGDRNRPAARHLRTNQDPAHSRQLHGLLQLQDVPHDLCHLQQE